MRVRYSGLVKTAAGTLGGNTHGNNKAGAFIKRHSTPKQANSEPQTAAKQRFAAATTAWKGLTDAQRASWEAIAEQINMGTVYKHLQPATGYSAFVHSAATRATLGSAPLAQAPQTLPYAREVRILDAEGIADAADPEAGSLLVRVSTRFSTQALHIYASAPMSPGRTALRKGDLKLIRVVAPGAVFDGQLITEYLDRFGDFPPSKKIALKVSTLNLLGFIGKSDEAQITIAAA